MISLRAFRGRALFAVWAALLILAVAAQAQDYRAKVQGIVTDTNKAALAGAKVTLKNIGTGIEVRRQTNADGNYIFDFVESGIYSVTIEAQGFKKFEQRNITIQNRGDVTVNAAMEIGGVTEVVTVQDSPVAVQFNSSSDTTTIGNEIMTQSRGNRERADLRSRSRKRGEGLNVRFHLPLREISNPHA